MVSSGLRDKGYIYVNIDDCWAVHSGRDANGNLVPDPVKFPNGIIGVANYVHSLNMKLGIYSDAGTNTCQGQPGSLNHEDQDAASFASWGVDYLKYDNCFNTGLAPQVRYLPMKEALADCGRPIFFSLCEWGQGSVWQWGNTTGNSWRSTQDIKDLWDSMKINYYFNSLHPESAGPGGWNDPDMLEVGNGGMSFTEYKTHFSLWAMAKAPLIIGCDLTQMSADTLLILSNTDLIAINQDSLGRQAVCRIACDYANYLSGIELQVWTGLLSNGDIVVGIVNWGIIKRDYHLNLRDISIAGNAIIYDLWDKTQTTADFIAFKGLAAHGTKMYRVTPIS